MICAKCGKEYTGSSRCTCCGYDITESGKVGFIFQLSEADVPLLIEQCSTKAYLKKALDMTSGFERWENGLEAVRWYVKAAVRDDIEALCNIGDVLLGGAHDSIEDVYYAGEMFCRAAELGSRDASELVDLLGLNSEEDDYSDEQGIVQKYREMKAAGRWDGDLAGNNMKLANIVGRYHSLHVDRMVRQEMVTQKVNPAMQMVWIRKNYQAYKELMKNEGENIKYDVLEMINNQGEII